MLIALKDVPHEERHLLFCSKLAPGRRRRRRRRRGNRRTSAQPEATSASAIVEFSDIPIAAGLGAAGTFADVA